MRKGYKKYFTQLLAIVLVINSLYLPAAAEAPLEPTVIISQVYGGGGNSGAYYKNDFIELYNPTSSPVDLTGWSVQYASATGTFSTNITELSGSIAPGTYYLIQEGAGANVAGTAVDLPIPNASGSIGMAGTAGKVALAKRVTAITGLTDVDLIDFVGYGTTASIFEGSGPTPTLSNTMAAIRKTEGVDTNDNAADFEVKAPNPRSSVEVVETKCEIPTASIVDGAVVYGTAVSFTTVTSGATIEYNTVSATEVDWTVGSSVSITSDITYYVRAVKDGIEASDVATFVYTIDTSQPVKISVAKNAPLNTENIKVKGIITYISGKNVYIQDDTDAICLYLTATATGLNKGDEIIAIGKRVDFSNLIELSGVDLGTITVVSSGNAIPVSDAVKISALIAVPEGKTAGYDYMCENIKIKDAILTSDALLTQDGISIAIYPKVAMVKFPDVAIGDNVDVTVRFYDYKGTLEIEISEMTVAVDDSITIKDALALPSGTTNVKVKGQIAYFAQSNNNPVIQAKIDDITYSLYVYGAAPEGAKVGDIVTLTGTFSIYKGLAELMSIVESKLVKSAPLFEPEVYTISEILSGGLGMIGRFVKIEGVTLGTYSTSNTPINVGADTINIFKATPYPAMVEAGEVVDLYAMVACYNTGIQLYTGTAEANGFNVYDVVNDTKNPALTLADSFLNAKAGQDYMISVGAQDNKGIQSVTMTYTIGSSIKTDQLMTYSSETGKYVLTIPGSEVVGSASAIAFTITATDVTGLTTTTDLTNIVIENKPVIISVTPARNSSTGDNKSPVITATLENVGVNPQITVTLKKGDTTLIDEQPMSELSSTPLVYSYETVALEDGSYTAIVNVVREDSQSDSETWAFTVGASKYQAYFGQLHAHTAQYSDGSGTLADGLDYIASISASDNVDFVAFTDHSNYFDTTASPNQVGALNDKSLMTPDSLIKWNNYVSAMTDFNQSHAGEVVAVPAFEMTWSGGPGHINTFNSDGLVSRNNATLNAKGADAGLKAYYDTLILNPDPMANLSQFNHPGATFGTFSDFAYWSPSYDNKMVAVEVGNGEGAIGSGGYFASYAEYTKALDKGWHVAPTNNQDNHKGHWGNANGARTVILTDDLSSDGLLSGLKNMSVYASEDKNLTIDYTVNDQLMGSIISEVSTEPLKFNVQIDDADITDTISKVEIVTNSGRVAESKAFESNVVDWSFELIPVQGYYYVRVTQADKNMAVTAPIWVGQAPLVGITSLTVDTAMPVTEEEVVFTTTIFNNESNAVTLNSIEYSQGTTVLAAKSLSVNINSTGSYNDPLKYTPTRAGESKVTVKVDLTVNGQPKTFTQSIDFNVLNRDKLVYIGIDGSHYNEYVNGNYKANMGNFANMAITYGVRVVELNTSEALIAATTDPKFVMLVLTTPTRRNGDYFLIGYKNYSDLEVAAVKAFAETGKTVIVTGWGDYYESYSAYSDKTPFTLPAIDHMSVQQNRLLEALGSNLRISDDEVKDDVNHGGTQNQRLYLTNYNLDNPFVSNVLPAEQVYSNYGGSTIYAVGTDGLPSSTLVNTISPMVYGHTTSYSSDDDKDGTTGNSGRAVPKYMDKYMVAASQEITYANGKTATIIAAGSVFMSNYEVQIAVKDIDSYVTPAYSNYTIVENIIKYINPITVSTIAEVQESEEGQTFTIRGTVTSNASGYDKDTAFFDCIYVQDGTAGINAFPVAGNIKAGQIVEITGTTSSYNGERQIAVKSIKVIDDTVHVLPTPLTLTVEQVANASHLGSLVKVEGNVHDIQMVNNVVESIIIKEGSKTCRIFIDGYITQTKEIANLKVGAKLTAVGLMSIDTLGSRIRIRDRSDVVCTQSSSGNGNGNNNNNGNNGNNNGNNGNNATTDINDETTPLAVPTDFVLNFKDIKTNMWYFSAVRFLAANKFTLGTSQDTYSPDGVLTRGQFMVILMRGYGIEPDATSLDNFADAGNTYYTNYLSAAKRLGLAKGITNNLFAPEEKLTRQEMFTLIYNALEVLSKLPENQGKMTLEDFKDADQIAEYALNPTKVLVEGGKIIGNKGLIKPKDLATRAEMAQLIFNLLGTK